MNKNLTTKTLLAAAVGSLALAGVASAATVTTLDGSQNWFSSYDTTATATSAITADQPRNGNGSVNFQTNSTAEKAVVGYFTSGTLGTLGDLLSGSVTFDYYRDSSSTTVDHQAPSFKFYVKNASNQSASLIWERVYNQSGAARTVPTDVWNDDESLVPQLFYIRSGGQSYDTAGNFMTLADFASGMTASSGGNTSIALGGDTVITGIELGVGSGLGPTFIGYVDDVNVAFGNGGQTISANFEPVPEPASLGLVGVAGLGLLARRRRGN